MKTLKRIRIEPHPNKDYIETIENGTTDYLFTIWQAGEHLMDVLPGRRITLRGVKISSTEYIDLRQLP